jgi:hypothetical protein
MPAANCESLLGLALNEGSTPACQARSAKLLTDPPHPNEKLLLEVGQGAVSRRIWGASEPVRFGVAHRQALSWTDVRSC